MLLLVTLVSRLYI